MSREAHRARVLYSNDPLQLSISQDDWIPPTDDTMPNESQDWLALAKRGSWRTIAQKSANFQTEHSDRLLCTASWHIIAQVKLDDIQGASQSLSVLGDLDAPEFSKSTNQGSVSAVPFALRRAVCECKSAQGAKEAQDALYALLHFCQVQQEDKNAKAPMLDLWRFREETLAASVFCHHYRQKEFDAALTWLAWLQKRYPDDVNLLLTSACVALSLGQTQHASQIVQLAARGSLEREDAAELISQIRTMKGLLLLAQNNIAGAVNEFQAVLNEKPGDRTATNNLAVSQVYLGNLASASKVLETSLQKHKEVLLQETVMGNMALMYDLLGVASAQVSKQKLADWLAQIGPHDLRVPSLS